jgi:hypothetical protein
LKRTGAVFAFLFVTSFIFGYAVELLGEDRLAEFMLTDSAFQPLLTALIGMIPNCAPSVILAELYLQGALSMGSVIAGLCTSAGVGLVVLFRVNKGFKSNLGTAGLLYAIGALSGVIIESVSRVI